MSAYSLSPCGGGRGWGGNGADFWVFEPPVPPRRLRQRWFLSRQLFALTPALSRKARGSKTRQRLTQPLSSPKLMISLGIDVGGSSVKLALIGDADETLWQAQT